MVYMLPIDFLCNIIYIVYGPVAQEHCVRPQGQDLLSPQARGLYHIQEVQHMTVEVYSTSTVHVDYSDVLILTAQDNGTVALMQQTVTKQTSQILLPKPHHVTITF